MKALLMTVLFSLAFNASAACPVKRPGALPLMPDGAVATEQEMYRAQLAAEKYLFQAEVYMDCDVMNRRQHLALPGGVARDEEGLTLWSAGAMLQHSKSSTTTRERG